MTDTTAIYRYRMVDSTQCWMEDVAFPATQPFIHYTLTFRRDSGLVQLAVRNLITMQGYERADHELLEGTVTDVTDRYQVRTATQVTLSNAYPNPFNPTTTIRYGLPQRSAVQLTIFNVLGQRVGTVVQGEEEAGYHEVKFDASGLPSGVYFYRMVAGDYVATKRLLVLR
jgi:hypothetical protein